MTALTSDTVNEAHGLGSTMDMRSREHSRPPVAVETLLGPARVALEQDPRVVFTYLFGGYGRGTPGPLSDVDLAVYIEPETDLHEARLDLIGTLTRVLGTDELDLVVLNTAPLSLAGRVQLGSRLLVDKAPGRRMAYESLIRRAFADFRVQEEGILRRRFARG
jgi:hypothetical protein